MVWTSQIGINLKLHLRKPFDYFLSLPLNSIETLLSLFVYPKYYYPLYLLISTKLFGLYVQGLSPGPNYERYKYTKRWWTLYNRTGRNVCLTEKKVQNRIFIHTHFCNLKFPIKYRYRSKIKEDLCH